MSKFQEWTDRLRQMVAGEGSYTLMVAPNNGKDIQSQHITKQGIRKVLYSCACGIVFFAGSTMAMCVSMTNIAQEHDELVAYQENKVEQEKKLQELSLASEKVQRDVADLNKIEKQVRQQMEEYGITLPKEVEGKSSMGGIGGPAENIMTGITVMMEQNKLLHQQVQSKTATWDGLLGTIKQENYRREMTPSVWPTNSTYVTSEFGRRYNPFDGTTSDWHGGLDIGDDYGAPIYATASGYVEQSGWYGGYGRYVRLSHDYGYQTCYGHMSSINVSVGEYVKKGEVIGYVGSSGYSTGPHLHYEVLLWGQEVNPREFL